MPTQTKIMLEKRMQIFLEHCKFKRQKSRMDVYMENLKLVSNKEIYELEDKDVLRYLIYKDVKVLSRGFCFNILSTISAFPFQFVGIRCDGQEFYVLLSLRRNANLRDTL